MKKYEGLQIGGEYAVFWLVAAVSIVLNVICALCLRRNLLVERSKENGDMGPGRMRLRWKWRGEEQQDTATERRRDDVLRSEGEARAKARQMLAYPIAYSEYQPAFPYLTLNLQPRRCHHLAVLDHAYDAV